MSPTENRKMVLGSGWAIGLLGGLIGLGGAEFRLPLLISFFRFRALEAVIINKAMSLIVVSTALPFRLMSIPFTEVLAGWDIVGTLLSGSLIGAWVGAGWATQIKSRTLYQLIAGLLVLMAVVLLLTHSQVLPTLNLSGYGLMLVGAAAGLAIGIVAALMGVAGGELLIPTITLLFGVDLKVAGSLSLAVSLPTMIAAFSRYSQDNRFIVIKQNKQFIVLMAMGSIIGTFTGGYLLDYIPTILLIPLLVLILLISSVKVWNHK